MRSSAVVAVFATSVAAQSTSSNEPKTGSAATIINPVGLQVSTLTVLGSSSGTTTYVNSCSDGGIPSSFLSEATAGPSSLKSSAASLASSARSAAGTLLLTPIAAPSTTAAARLRRQDGGDLLESLCEPLTIKQASESAHVQLKDPTEGAWTADFNCNWKGPVASADLTCTATQSGFFATALEVQGTTSVVIKASEAAKARIVQTVEVVSPASNSATPTASGTQSGSANSTASGSGAPAATNAAAGAPLPMGMMAFVGGAAGVFAAALAL